MTEQQVCLHFYRFFTYRALTKHFQRKVQRVHSWNTAELTSNKLNPVPTVSAGQNGRAVFTPPPPDYFFQLFISVRYCLLSWNTAQEVLAP